MKCEPRNKNFFRMLSCLLVCFLVLVGLAFAGGEKAFAEEEEDSNRLNPHQLPDSSFIYDTSIGDLSMADAYYDGQTVQVVGEAIGDNIKADSDGKYRWITLSAMTEQKADATIIVFMTEEAASRIDSFGKYGTVGTTVRVRGTYHLACSDHEGLSDIHASYVSIVQPGRSNPDSFEIATFMPGMVTVAVGLVLFALFYFIRERRR